MSKNNIEVKDFTKVSLDAPVPDLLDIQIASWIDFLQEETLPEKRLNKGLESTFKNIFPIEDNNRNYILEYKHYYLGLPKHSVKECLERRISYSVPLKVKFVLHITDENDKNSYVQDIEQDVFFGNIPYMSSSGTFIINGAERVIVSQLQRSPGVFFDQNLHPNGTKIFLARIIPFRGSWVDFTTDIYDCIYAIIDRRRKFPATVLLRAIGFSTNAEILDLFGLLEHISISDEKLLVDRIILDDIVDKVTGEVIVEKDSLLSLSIIQQLKKNKIKSIPLSVQDRPNKIAVELLSNTFDKDPTSNTEGALNLLYKQLRAGDAPSMDIAQKFIDKMFFSTKKYDLGAVGRYRINKKFGLDAPTTEPVLTRDDFVEVFKYLIKMRNGEHGPDDIDHLGNRRVRTVGEQLANQFNIALSRMHRTIRERMNQREAESLTPQDLVNSRIVSTVLSTFFGTSQLSQFMDQTNPLAEVTHKRRISSLGPGGLSRERAGFEVRDVHYTHYGRLCPIETPEGPNIGLINSLATQAVVNNLGFIESPYRTISREGRSYKITDNVQYLSPDEEDRSFIAEASEPIKNNKFANKFIRSRNGVDFPISKPSEIDYMDVSPNQIVSVSAALIPFLENDDANRALMGSNMMRQSVPLMKPEEPIVGTGMEATVAADSRACLISDVKGTITYVDAEQIKVKIKDINPELDLIDTNNSGDIIFHFLKQNSSIDIYGMYNCLDDNLKITKLIIDRKYTKFKEEYESYLKRVYKNKRGINLLMIKNNLNVDLSMLKTNRDLKLLMINSQNRILSQYPNLAIKFM